MKSIHVTAAALALTGITLGLFASALGSPDRMLGRSYDRALANAQRSEPSPRQTLAAAKAVGSEHFWLTQPVADGVDTVAPVSHVNDVASLNDIRLAIAKAGALDVSTVDVVTVQDVARTSLHGELDSTGRTLLVTAKIQASDRAVARTVRVVVDVGTVTTAKTPSAL